MTTFTTFSPAQEQRHYAQRVFNWEFSGPQGDSYHNDPSEYWCDTCDKGFRAAYLLEKHKKSHQKCNIDGCQFIAHPSVITKHIQMQHSTGLYKKICKLNEPEDIKRWREERKKKYPTKDNIEKKLAQMKEKIARGEKIGICDRGKKKQHRSDYATKKLKSFKNNRNRMYDKRPDYKNKNNDNTTDEHMRLGNITLLPIEISRTLKPFAGIQHLVLETDDIEKEVEITNNDLIEEDEYIPDVHNILDKTVETSEIKVCGALTSLICNYGSSEEEDNIDIIEKKSIYLPENKNIINTVRKNTMEENTRKNCNSVPNGLKGIAEGSSDVLNEVDNDSGPEESKIIKEHINFQENGVKEQKINSKKHNKAKLLTNIKNRAMSRNNTYRRKLPSTLLEKLLHGEIKKERNIVLQCIRYIVKNNYFDTESIK